MSEEASAETRADVCEDCPQLLHREPLTCKLVTRRLQSGDKMPCPHALARMLSSQHASCPNPDDEWATRWGKATMEQPRSVVVPAKPAELTPVEAARQAMRQRRTRGVSRHVFRVGAVTYDQSVA